MAQHIDSIFLDVSDKLQKKSIYAKQGDCGSRFVRVTMTREGNRIVPEAGATAQIRALKPDGNSVVTDAVINSDGTITAELTEQMLAVAGNVLTDIVLLGAGGDILSTVTFCVRVAPVPIGQDLPSTNEFKRLNELLDEAEQIIDDISHVPGGGGIAAFYRSVERMQASEVLYNGNVVETAGFYSDGDGGGARYVISDTGTEDGVFVHALANGLFANLIIESGFVNVKQAGAKGDGVTDDTDVLEAVLDNADCTTVFFPEGVYRVTPKLLAKNASAPDRIIKLARTVLHIDRDNVTVCGDGAEKSVIKLADGITDRYRSIIVVHGADNVTIRDIGIDQNPEGSPLLPEPGSTVSQNDPDEADGGTHYRDLYKLNCIATSGAMENLRIANCAFRHNGSQAIMANSNISNLVIEDNRFSFAPSALYSGGTTPDDLYYPRSSGPEFDNSTIYLRGHNAVVRNNRMFSECDLTPVDTYCLYNGSAHTDSENFDDEPTGQVFLRARTAIENHASGVIIEGNYAENYSAGVIMNQDTDGPSNSHIIGNTFTDVCSGVAFWWKAGYTNPGVTVRGNRITQTVKWYDNSVKNPSKYAHAFQSATAGVLKDIDISGNTVIFDRDSMTDDAEDYGLESSAGFASVKAVEIDGLVIADNVFLDLPVYGVYLHAPSGSTNVTGATIRGNLFRNCGWCDKLNAALKDDNLKNKITRRAAIEISPTTLVSCEVFDNDIVDASTGGECGEAIIISDSTWVASGAVTLKDNRIRSLSGAGFGLGSTAVDNMTSIIDGTNQFRRFNVVEDEPTDIVAKVGQVFTNGVKTWKCTTAGSIGRSIGINSVSLKVVQRTSGGLWTTILTAATEAHGLRVGDTVTLNYNGTSKSLTVLLVNGATIYTTDWSSSALSDVTASIAINNKGVIEEQPIGTQYTAGAGITIENGEISLTEAPETFPIPGSIPEGVSAIGQYTVNGATTVLSDVFVHAEGTISVGNQSITLPELMEYESLTVQANGSAVKTSHCSGELELKDMVWNHSSSGTQDNEDSVYFYSSTDLTGAASHSDSTLAEDFMCNVLPSNRINAIMPSTYTQHGIGIGSSNRLRVRLTKAEMIAAGVSAANVTSVENGFLVWCAAVDARVIYEKTTATTTSTSVDPLTQHTGVVAFTGGYPDGTMTAIDQQTQIDDLAERIADLETPEVTVSSTGSVSQALVSGTAYHFTGALTDLTITLTAPASGTPHYHFDFVSGATAVNLTLPNDVTMPDGFSVAANKRYEIDILNGWGVASEWAISS